MKIRIGKRKFYMHYYNIRGMDKKLICMKFFNYFWYKYY